MLEFETTEVACGAYHVIAITCELIIAIHHVTCHVIHLLIAEGTVYAWGKGERGQLGLGSHDQHHTPQLVTLPPGDFVPVLACCSSDCSIIVTNSGQILATGANK